MKNVKTNHSCPVVCLDAGHYAFCNRSPVVPSYWESKMTWPMHKFLATALREYGINIVFTRDDQEKDLSLVARGEKSEDCDLFISIHSNACGTEKVDRPCGIYMVTRDGTDVDDKSKEIATILADVVADVMKTHDKAKVYSRMARSDRNHDGKRNDNYYGVLHGAWMVGTPGIILEHSFHTNKRSAEWLSDEANLKKMAVAEARAIARWFGITDAGGSAGGNHTKPVEPEKPHIPAKPEPKPDYKIVGAKERSSRYSHEYIVNGRDGSLNMRVGPGTKYTLIKAIPNGTVFRCYGYHTGKWLYGVLPDGTKGYCDSSKGRLRRK